MGSALRSSRRPSRARRLAAVGLASIAALAAQRVEAQARFGVTGVVADSAGAGVGGAMVVALALPDSVLTEWTTTGGDGAFALRVSPGEYVLQVTLLGHRTVRQPLSVIGADVAAGRIELEVLAVEIDPLVVTVEHVPFLNRRDTLSFNALAFEVRPNATVEDLLRRLPGIEVEEDGSIRAQGEDVQNVLVDGKEFFGNDPTVATRNLPAAAVERVDVYDRESDTAEFTGIPDGQEERTINLGLKEEARHGYFGDLAGGLGSEAGTTESLETPGFGSPAEDRVPYDGQVSINRFSPATQLAVIGNATNVGRPGFRRGGDGPSTTAGLFENLSAGVNASHDFGSDTWIRSSYFFGRSENLENGTREEERLLGSEVASLIQGVDESRSEDVFHRVDLNSQVRFAEGHEIRIRSDIQIRSAEATSSNRQTQTVMGEPLNSAVTDRLSDLDQVGVDGRLTWRKRLSDSGRSLIAEARVEYNDSDRLTELASMIESGSDPALDEDILQEQMSAGETLNHSLRLSVTEPLGERNTLELFGERSAIDENQGKTVFDLDEGTPVLDPFLSSEFDRIYTYLRGGLRLSRNEEDKRFVVGFEVQSSDLEGRVLATETEVGPISTGFTHFLPLAELRLELKEGRNLRIRYNTSTREPSLTQFQPFADNDDPLDVYVGNPDLKPEYRHQLRGEYRLFDQFSFVNLFTYASLVVTNDNISQSRSVDETGRQVTSPVNSGRAWSANTGVNFGTPVRPIGARLELDYRLAHTRESAFVNAVENESRIWQHTLDASIQNRDKTRFDVRAGGGLAFHDVGYSLNRELDRSYVNPRLSADAALYLGGWTVATELDFQGYDADVFGPNLNVTMWEASITRLIMGDRAEIQLAAYDLLDQNQGVSVTNTASFNRTERVQSLGRHVMLRFDYHLGSSAMRDRGGRGGPGRRDRR